MCLCLITWCSVSAVCVICYCVCCWCSAAVACSAYYFIWGAGSATSASYCYVWAEEYYWAHPVRVDVRVHVATRARNEQVAGADATIREQATHDEIGAAAVGVQITRSKPYSFACVLQVRIPTYYCLVICIVCVVVWQIFSCCVCCFMCQRIFYRVYFLYTVCCCTDTSAGYCVISIYVLFCFIV